MAKPKRREADALTAATDLRIVGGKFRGRKLKYDPFRIGDDPVTRPMKHRVRESIFNLVSQGSEGRHALDLFAGTGALGLEALSRGAVHATFIERHVPTARVIEENIKSLGVEAQATLLVTSAFLWGKRELGNAEGGMLNAESPVGAASGPSAFSIQHSALPWLVFCSPPYAFFVDRQAEMLELIEAVRERAPEDSLFVVETDERFDFELLPGEWDVRTYAPAVVGVWHKR
jgi:16S rRNA (guanine966-N2)-methyltransferase